MFTHKSSFVIPLLTLSFGSAACSASYHKISPPNTILLGYPGGNVTAGEEAVVGVEAGELPHPYYALAWNTSISLAFPNGTHTELLSISDGAGCAQTFWTSSSSPPGQIGYSANLDANYTSQTGSYMVFWNTTYGTTDDSTVANQTFCDPTHLSYQTWIVNASFDVVPKTGNGVLVPSLTKVAQTLIPSPTGTIWVSNDAQNAAAGVAPLIGTALLAAWQLL